MSPLRKVLAITSHLLYVAIETNSSKWHEAEERELVIKEALNILHENSELAFHHRELADEIMQTDWGSFHKEKRKMQEMGRDAYNNSDLNIGPDPFEMLIDRILTERLISILDRLVENEQVETRYISLSESDLPSDDPGRLLYYTHADK